MNNAITKIQELGFAIFGVYGTLKSGFRNNYLLGDSEYIDSIRVKGFDLYSLGGFPGAVEGHGEITVELFKVTDPSIAVSLYQLEGYNGHRGHPNNTFYDTVDIKTGIAEFPKAEIFLYKGNISQARKIQNGEW